MDKTSITSSLRDRNAQERSEQILNAAAQLFAERGFHRTTTREIAQAANVSEGTLYNYFENKNDLLFGILSQLSDSQESAELASEITTKEAREFLSFMLDLHRDEVARNTTMLQAIMSEILANEELRKRYAETLLTPSMLAVENNLNRRIKLTQIRPLDTVAAARVITALWIGLFFLDVLEDPVVISEWDRTVDAISSILFEGISPQTSPT